MREFGLTLDCVRFDLCGAVLPRSRSIGIADRSNSYAGKNKIPVEIFGTQVNLVRTQPSSSSKFRTEFMHPEG